MSEKLSQATSAVTSTGQETASQAQNTANSGSEKWDAMTEEQKKKTFDSLPDDQKQGKSYVEWIKEGYHNQYENWMPWIEDQYLKWFTKDNKASYATKDTLGKTKVTGIDQVDNVQDGVNNLVAGQVGQGGLLQPVGDMASKQGLNRAERGGKDKDGSYGGAAAGITDPVVDNAKSAGQSLGSGAQGLGNSITSGAKGAGSYVGKAFGGGDGQQQEQQATQ